LNEDLLQRLMDLNVEVAEEGQLVVL